MRARAASLIPGVPAAPGQLVERSPPAVLGAHLPGSHHRVGGEPIDAARRRREIRRRLGHGTRCAGGIRRKRPRGGGGRGWCGGGRTVARQPSPDRSGSGRGLGMPGEGRRGRQRCGGRGIGRAGPDRRRARCVEVTVPEFCEAELVITVVVAGQICALDVVLIERVLVIGQVGHQSIDQAHRDARGVPGPVLRWVSAGRGDLRRRDGKPCGCRG